VRKPRRPRVLPNDAKLVGGHGFRLWLRQREAASQAYDVDEESDGGGGHRQLCGGAGTGHHVRKLGSDGGEGRSITVRGLSGQFTQVRVNGMQALTTSSDGASADRERAFDFNVFASELFSSIVVHKTAEASLDEGSLGAVVDLGRIHDDQGS